MIRSITKNPKKLIVCLLDSCDRVSVESLCQRNKLCTKAIPLVPLHGQKDLFILSYKKHTVAGNKQYSYIPLKGSAWFFFIKSNSLQQINEIRQKEYFIRNKNYAD